MVGVLIDGLTTLLLWATAALAAPQAAAVTPVVASTTSYGSLSNALSVTRDSCTSSAWWGSVVLWVCRDTEQIVNGAPILPVVASTASYSGLPTAKTNPQPLVLTSPQGFTTPFYPLESDECPIYGACSDGTRWVGWPDTGPVVTFQGTTPGQVNAYAFIARQHLSGLTVENQPSHTLYHLLAQASGPMPTVSVDVSQFWSTTQIGYGSAASVVRNGFAYLYGATPNGKLAVARAATTGFLGALDDKSLYQYYVNGAWTSTAPVWTDTTIPLPNTSDVQGTIYWSPKWSSYVWIGGDGFPNANFYISTAPNPEGPWTAAKLFYSGVVGVGSLPAYSAVAHPSLTDGTGDYIFISWTRTIDNAQGNQVYDQPLVRVDWS